MDDTKKNRRYSEIDLKSAIENVLNSTMTVYRASKEFKIPWSTLKENVSKYKILRESNPEEQILMSKIGRPFALPIEIEQKLLAYIIEMQELGFGLSVTKVKQIALSLAKAANINCSFNEEKGSAGWNWWVKFKERYGLSLRTPENLSAGRAICSNPVILEDFYDKLEKQLTEHYIPPERIWNCDETGLMFVNKPNKIVTSVGKKYVYNRTYAEKGTTTTLLACVDATGCYIPPYIIFKGVRVIPQLKKGFMPNAQVRFSPKGWITGELFLDWLKFFVRCIPPARPVLLIMDSHASHVVPPVLEYARSQNIILFTIPSHTSAILQPLDVSVHRPLKVAWRTIIEAYKIKNPCKTPNRYDFHKFFTPAFEKSFSPTNIRSGFEKAGIYPFNRTAVNPLALAPSKLTDKPFPESTEETTLHEDEQIQPSSTSRIKLLEEIVYMGQGNGFLEKIDDPVCDPLHSAGFQLEYTKQPVQFERDEGFDNDAGQNMVLSIYSQQHFTTTDSTDDKKNDNDKETESSRLRKVRIPLKPISYQVTHSVNENAISTAAVLGFSESPDQSCPKITAPVLTSPNSYGQQHTKITTTQDSSSPTHSKIITARGSSIQKILFKEHESTEQNKTFKIRILEEIRIPAPDSKQKLTDQLDEILKVPKLEQNPIKKRSKKTTPHARCLTPFFSTVNKNLDDDGVIAGTSGTSILKTADENLGHEADGTSGNKASNKKRKDAIVTVTSRSKRLNDAASSTSKFKTIVKLENNPNTAPARSAMQKLKNKNKSKDDDWLCEICKRWYSEDAASKNGADWISCSYCFKTYHVHCQSQELGPNATVFQCDMCYAEKEF